MFFNNQDGTTWVVWSTKQDPDATLTFNIYLTNKSDKLISTLCTKLTSLKIAWERSSWPTDSVKVSTKLLEWSEFCRWWAGLTIDERRPTNTSVWG